MEQVLTFGFVMKLIREYGRIIAILSMLGGIIAASMTLWIMQPQYQASVQVLVNRKHISAGADLTGQQADIQMITTYKELIMNPVVLKPVRQSLLRKDQLQRSLNMLKQAVTVTSTANSQVFSIVVRDRNAQASAVIANQIAATFQKQVQHIIKVNNVTIVAPAEVPQIPVTPKKVLNILIGVVGGLLFGLVVASVRVLTNRRVQTLEFLTEELQLTNLGLVNHQLQQHTPAGQLNVKQPLDTPPISKRV